jgi:hypothetical protein
MVRKEAFQRIMDHKEMPTLSEDDMIGELFMPEVMTMLIMQDMKFTDMFSKEARELANDVRLESEWFGSQLFKNIFWSWVDSAWCPGFVSTHSLGMYKDLMERREPSSSLTHAGGAVERKDSWRSCL